TPEPSGTPRRRRARRAGRSRAAGSLDLRTRGARERGQGARTLPALPRRKAIVCPMAEPIRIVCVQMTSRADKAANIQPAERLVAEAASTGADVVVLPEKWNAIGDS